MAEDKLESDELDEWDSIPELWNPHIAVLLSVFFTPIFGTWIIAKNWEVLELPNRAKKSMIWVLFGIIFLSLNFASPLPTGPFYLLVWYFVSAKAQTKYIKQNYANTGYDKKAWGKPILFGFAAFFAMVTIASLYMTQSEQEELFHR